jgi:hypothetical protein
MDGDYSQPFEMPIPNFVTMRSLAQVLGQRTKCYLFLGQPEKALHEVTLLNDSRRLLEAAPTGKPMTLVAAMINVAVTGLYVETIANGLQSRAWQEPQLTALQKQLAEINLSPFVAEAFKDEQAAVCHTAEIVEFRKITMVVTGDASSPKTLWQKVKNLKSYGYDLMPRGWVYQNMVVAAKLSQKRIDAFNPANAIVSPPKIENAMSNLAITLDHSSLFGMLADISNPNFTKAIQTTAHNQTLANEAQIVCALERYHLAHGEYPESLDALAPRFIEKMPHDIINGQPLHFRRTDDENFLLYSVGWSEKDDGGQIAFRKGGSVDWLNGDWVWEYPQK